MKKESETETLISDFSPSVVKMQHSSPWTQLFYGFPLSYLLINPPLGSWGTTEAWWEILSWQAWWKFKGAVQQFCTRGLAFHSLCKGLYVSAVLEAFWCIWENNTYDVMERSPRLSWCRLGNDTLKKEICNNQAVSIYIKVLVYGDEFW